jgi:ADP-ribose pyrophosphatase
MAMLFSEENRRIVYQGYVDDPRNTNNAWMETVAANFHCDAYLRQHLRLSAGTDAADVFWLDVNPDSEEFKKLYANHAQLVLLAALSRI